MAQLGTELTSTLQSASAGKSTPFHQGQGRMLRAYNGRRVPKALRTTPAVRDAE